MPSPAQPSPAQPTAAKYSATQHLLVWCIYLPRLAWRLLLQCTREGCFGGAT
jgi:hypothetical protein